MGVLSNLEPQKVFHFFEEISTIPRGSGNEAEIAAYMVKFAQERGLYSLKDELNNVLIKKPGSAGKENAPTVILQGHLDMVCEKNAGVKHDFTKEPLKLAIDGDDIYAVGTTLGADNGIAAAMIMAVLDDKNAIHPPLECLLTSLEEVGLEGAAGFDYSNISGKYLINLDAENFGTAIVSCAGGLKTETELSIDWTDTSLADSETYAIRVRGLTGGHSGQDINRERANSNKLLGRVLDHLYGKLDFELCSISGGMKDNAIPREAQAYINICAGDVPKLESLLEGIEGTVTDEYRFTEKNITIKSSKEEQISRVFSRENTQKAIASIMTIPNGVIAYSREIEGLVETSNNLGVITMEENSVVLSCAIRSSVESRKEYVEAAVRNAALLAGAKFTAKSRYPGWRYDSESKLRKTAGNAFKSLTGNELKFEAIHAGLECGIIKEKLPEADLIAFGPNMSGVHTPEERLSISSTGETYKFLTKLLEEI